jgi:spoIIIJ-associated protein
MEVYEFNGKTPEEAIASACRELNVAKEELDIEIVEPGSAGIFGLVGSRKARIKVKVLEEEYDFSEEETPQTEDHVPLEEADAELYESALSLAKTSLEEILKRIPADDGVRVSAERENETITLLIDGDKSGLLIGRKGRTLDALQFIINKIVNKNMDQRIQLVIDSENYRERRRDFLIQMALKLADKAKRSRKPAATNLLNPHDRRIVHLALRKDGGLETRSRGEGILKKVIIIPKKSASSR